jgi:hypothetical protein
LTTLDQQEVVETRMGNDGTVTVVRTITGPNSVTVIRESRDRNGNVSRQTQTSNRSGGGNQQVVINNNIFGGSGNGPAARFNNQGFPNVILQPGGMNMNMGGGMNMNM